MIIFDGREKVQVRCYAGCEPAYIIAVLRARGLCVPGDVSVAGFDDLPAAADVTPALTTVRLPLTDMGERAMAMALDADSRKQRVVRLDAELVLRERTAPPAS